MARRHWALASLAASILIALSSTANAADSGPRTTEPGKALVITTETGAITEEKASLGTVSVSKDNAVPKPHSSLIYLPPPDINDASATVTYKVDGGETKSIAVQVRSSLISGDTYSPSFKAIFELFVVAVLVESGLALIFHWRPFLSVFDPKAVNGVIAFLFSLAFVVIFKFDIVSQLLRIYVNAAPSYSDWPGTILTAMIIAGGSTGVNRIFQAFGFRSTSTQDLPPPAKPPADKAWIAVTPIRDKARGTITVLIGPPGSSVAAGTIQGTAKRRWWSVFFRDKGRFPPSGGFAVAPGTYEVRLAGVDDTGKAISSTASWGPCAIAPGAIIDLSFTI